MQHGCSGERLPPEQRGPLATGWSPSLAPALSHHWAQPVLCPAAWESCQVPSLEGVVGITQGEAAPVSGELVEIPAYEGCAVCCVAAAASCFVHGLWSWCKEGQAFLCFLAGPEPAPAWSFVPCSGVSIAAFNNCIYI